jgi:hypothetical protein
MQGAFPFRPPWWAILVCLVLAAGGALTLAAGATDEAHRVWANVLLLSNYLIGLSLGSLLLVALLYVTGARWSTPLRRLPEALALALPVGAVGLVAVLFFEPSLYPSAADSAPGDALVSPLRAVWLARPFFLLRVLVYLAVWMLFVVLVVRNSRLQDRTGDPALTRSNVRLSAGFLVVFGITCWLSSSDWLMSLEPDWASTIFGVYNFAGMFLSALAAVVLLAVWLRRGSPLRPLVTEDRLHDLGTLLFGFSSFWAYTWFCQYLLIWYTNHPEESIYFVKRSTGPWPALLLLALVLNWGAPFLLLLGKAPKRQPVILGTAALMVLAGRWVDLFVIVFPSQGERLATPGWIEAGLAAGAAGIFGLAVLRALARAPLFPVNDPFLTAPLHEPAATGSMPPPASVPGLLGKRI